jgi:hypothetical protein
MGVVHLFDIPCLLPHVIKQSQIFKKIISTIWEGRGKFQVHLFALGEGEGGRNLRDINKNRVFERLLEGPLYNTT